MLRTLDEQRWIDEDSQEQRDLSLQINQVQKERSERSSTCKQMLFEILEISNQAFDLLQKTDSKEIDPWNWNEWVQLFRDDVGICDHSTETSTLVGNESLAEVLDEDQLEDYLHLKGQWTP